MNLYNKAYTSIKETVPSFKNSEDAIGFYLEGAAKHLAKAEVAAKEGRIQDRSDSSDKALLIFSGILSHLEQFPSQEKQAIKGLIEYCYTMNEIILRMNIKNDLEMAASLPREVKRMAAHWKDKAEQVFAKASALAATEMPANTEGATADFVAWEVIFNKKTWQNKALYVCI